MMETSALPDWEKDLRLKHSDFRDAGNVLRRTGGMDGVSPAAWLFFVWRVRLRRQVAVRFLLPGLLVGVGVAIAVGFATRLRGPFGHAATWVPILIFSEIAQWLGAWSESRQSARFLDDLGTRVSRERRIAMWEVLGVPRAMLVCVVFVAQSAFVAAVLADYPANYAAAILFAFVVAWTWIAWVLYRAWRRPALAVDGSSLALDERLRSQDASSALLVLFVSAWFFASVIEPLHNPRHDLYRWAFALQFVGLAGQILATTPRRWRQPGTKLIAWRF